MRQIALGVLVIAAGPERPRQKARGNHRSSERT